MVIFGDWGYGAEDDRYGIAPGNQYGDERLEPQLQGDDDIILVIRGDNSADETEEAYVFAGDGDDEIEIG